MGNVAVYSRNACRPENSATQFYTAILPAPEREGYRFDGWYNEKGERVERLDWVDFFPTVTDEDGLSIPDFSAGPYKLTAKWIKK